MQRPGRLDPDHRCAIHAAGGDQPIELLDAITQHRQRHRIADQAALPGRQPDAIADLPRIDRDDQPIRRDLSEQQPLQDDHPPTQRERKDPPGSRRRGPLSTPL